MYVNALALKVLVVLFEVVAQLMTTSPETVQQLQATRLGLIALENSPTHTIGAIPTRLTACREIGVDLHKWKPAYMI